MQEMWSRIVSTIRSAFVRTPVEVLIAVVTAAAFSAAIADWIEPETLARVAITAILLMCATFATSALHALKVFDGRTRWVLTGVFAAAIGAYGTFWLNIEHLTELWRFAFLGLAGVMAIALTPVAARLGETSASERFWRFNTRLIFRVAVAACYAGLLYGGTALGFLAVDGLFDLHIDDEFYGHLFSVLGIGLGSILAVGSLGNVARIDTPYGEAEMVWFGRLGTFLFVPLLIFYVGILYLYLGKVMLTGDVPSNILSPLALGAGILGYAGIFVLQPFLKRDDHRPLAFVLRAFPTAFVPLVPLGIWAVAERIGQYGWTEFRYARIAALVCLGVFSVVGTWRWIRGRDFSLTYGPAIVGIVAFAGAVGPWGASYVSFASQEARMVESLAAANLIEPDGRIAAPERVRAVDSRDIEQAREAAEYLLKTHGVAELDARTPADLADLSSRWDRLGAIGLEAAPSLRTVYFNKPWQEPLQFERGGTFTDFTVNPPHRTDVRDLAVELRDNRLVVEHDGERFTTSVEPFVARVSKTSAPSQTLPEELRQLHLVDESGNIAGELAVRAVHLQETPDGWEPTHVSAYVNLWSSY